MADPKDPQDFDAETAAEETVEPTTTHPITPDPEETPAVAATELPPTDADLPEAPKPKSNSKLLTGLAAGLAGLLLIASIAAAIFFYLQYDNKKEILDAQDAAKQAACDYAPTLATYDFNHLDEYFKKVLDGSTGEFKKQFGDSSKELKDVLVQGQVKSEVNDAQCGIKSGDKDHAEAIIVIGQGVTSVGTKGQAQPNQISMVASMEKDGDRWLVSKMDAPLVKPQ